MEAIDLQAAQKRLGEKRASLKLTKLEPISLVDGTTASCVCNTCNQPFDAVIFLGSHSFICDDCARKASEKQEAYWKEQERIHDERALKSRIYTRLKNSGIGDRFKNMQFGDYKPSCDKAKTVLEGCINYVDCFEKDSGCNLLMIGSPGTGKNMLAAIICQEIINKDFEAIHTTAMKLVRRIKSSWDKNSDESEQSAINSYVTPSLLIIDEIGVQFGSATELLFLTEVINERYERRRPTILISNLKLSQLTEVMGERVIDRFYDDGSKFLVFDWDSYRRKSK